MDTTTTLSLSRRAVLAAAAGGSAALVVRSLVAPTSSLADTTPGVPDVVVTKSRATIAAGATNVTVSAGVDLREDSVVVCSFLSNPDARSITHVAIDAETNAYTVHVSKKAKAALELGCVVVTNDGGSTSGPVSPPVSGGG